MFLRFNKPDRRILAAASLMVLIALYFLYDDSLLMSFDSDSGQPVMGKVSELENDVRYKYAKRFAWKTARKETVRLGDSIFTGSGSKATIEFKDGRSLVIQQNSLVVISNVGDQMKLDLRFGSFGGNLDGCIQVDVQGKSVDICGNKSDIEINSQGDVKVKTGTAKVADKQIKPVEKEVLIWAKDPEQNFYHSSNNRYLDLAWQAQKPYGRYRVQFSKDGKFKATETQDTTQELSLQTKNYPRKGEYFMRVQAENINGEMAAATPAVKIKFYDLVAPQILTPISKQSLEFKTDIDGDPAEPVRTTVTWEYANPAKAFQLEISKDSAFSQLVDQQEIKSKSYDTKELTTGVYFVRVRDTQKDRPWSGITQFEVKLENLKELEAPKLLTKTIKYIAPSKESPLAKWETKSPAPKYIIETSSTPEFRPEETVEVEATSNSLPLTVTDPGKTFFRVSSISKKGRRSPASETGTLLTRIDVPVLNPVAPISTMGKSPEDMGSPLDVNVSWSDLKIADSYEIELAEDPTFKRKIKYRAPASTSQINVPKPGEYHWRVRGLNRQGKPITKYSKPDKINYDLKVPLSQPVLVEPLANMTLFFQKKTSPYIWLEWKPVRQATSYMLELSPDPNFSRIIYQKSVKSARHLIQQKIGNGKIYWRTQAIGNDGRMSYWSEPRLMTIWSGTNPTDRQPASKRRR